MSGFGLQQWGLDGWGGVGPSSSAAALAVQNISPPAGALLAENQAITFDIVTPGTLTLVLISAEFSQTGIVEMVYDNINLTPYYRNPLCFVTPGTGILSFSLLRTPKWSDPVTVLHVFAADSTGATLSRSFTWPVSVGQIAAAAAATGSTSTPRSNFDSFGFGIVRPFRRVSTNDFETASGPALVRAAVGQVLGTGKGEILWRPRFGTLLTKLRHMRNTAALPELARISIEEALRQWEPRISVEEVSAESITLGNENKVLLSISYRIGNVPGEAVRVAI